MSAKVVGEQPSVDDAVKSMSGVRGVTTCTGCGYHVCACQSTDMPAPCILDVGGKAFHLFSCRNKLAPCGLINIINLPAIQSPTSEDGKRIADAVAKAKRNYDGARLFDAPMPVANGKNGLTFDALEACMKTMREMSKGETPMALKSTWVAPAVLEPLPEWALKIVRDARLQADMQPEPRSRGRVDYPGTKELRLVCMLHDTWTSSDAYDECHMCGPEDEVIDCGNVACALRRVEATHLRSQCIYESSKPATDFFDEVAKAAGVSDHQEDTWLSRDCMWCAARRPHKRSECRSE